MLDQAFPDAALVLLGHGTTLNEDSAAPVLQHAATLRRKKCFAEVREAFWKQSPQVLDVLATLATPRVFIVPFFISEGYFSESAIPKGLGFGDGTPGFGRVRSHGSQKLFYCRPVGTDDRMTDVLLDRALEVVQTFPFPRAPKPADLTLIIAGHGTGQNENSRKSIERQAELVRARNLYAAVHAVFLEEDPRIPEAFHLAQTKNIVVVPFFISDGLHARQDIPVLLGQPARLVQERLQKGLPTWRNPTELRGKRLWYAPSVGTDPKMTDVILDRVREALRFEV